MINPEFKDVEKLKKVLKEKFKNSYDIKIEVVKTAQADALAVYVDGLIDRNLLDRDIIGPLKAHDFSGDPIRAIRTSLNIGGDIDDMTDEILLGNLAVFYEGELFICDIKKFEKRSVETPDAESVTRGPKEGFNEDLVTNTSLLRRKIRNPNFVCEKLSLGAQTNTNVVIAYISGIVNVGVLDLVRKRLSKINIDGILETGTLEQFIERHSFSTVSGIGLTQKPDVVASKILEGRVAVLCDGSPHVITIPELFIENLHTPEDHYHKLFFASFIRLLRLLGLFISLLLPGLVVSVVAFNPEMLPSTFLVNLMASKDKTPFPEAFEILFMVVMLELLKESGTRLPKTIGSAVSIVGALIIGEAAVSAGLVSAPSVIVVALTAVSSFILPSLNEFTTIYRLLFILAGASFGIIGIGAGLLFMLTQISSINSFGIPVMAFFGRQELKDSFIRGPLRSLKFRPQEIAKDNVRRAQ